MRIRHVTENPTIAFATLVAIVTLAHTAHAQRQGEEPAPRAEENTIEIFRHDNLQDRMLVINPVTKSADEAKPKNLETWPFFGPADQMTSLVWDLRPGIVVVFYQYKDGEGTQFVIWGRGQYRNLKAADFNDRASSWAWFDIGGGPSGVTRPLGNQPPRPLGTEPVSSSLLDPDSVQVFNRPKFKPYPHPLTNVTGRKQGVHQSLDELDNKMSSLRWKLRPGVLVLFYDKHGGDGRQFAIWGQGQSARLPWGLKDMATSWQWIDVGASLETLLDPRSD